MPYWLSLLTIFVLSYLLASLVESVLHVLNHLP